MHMPTEQEIAAKVRELSLPSDAPIAQARAEAVKALLAERAAPAERAKGHVLSRSVVTIADGYLEITATYYPEGTAQ